MQGVDDIEILVVDDASDDGTSDWLAAEAQRDFRIVPLQGPGLGPGKARNLAVERARAPFIGFLDADDMWWPHKLQRALAFHEANRRTAFSFTNYLHVDTRGEVRGTCFDYWRPHFADYVNLGFRLIEDPEMELLAANVVGTSTVMASSEAVREVGGFTENMRSAQDWDLWLRLAARGPVACSAATTATYLMRPSSVTQNKAARIDAMRKIVRRYAGRTEPKAKESIQRALARIDIAEAERARAMGRPAAAACAHLQALVKWPETRTAKAAAADIFTASKNAMQTIFVRGDMRSPPQSPTLYQ